MRTYLTLVLRRDLQKPEKVASRLTSHLMSYAFSQNYVEDIMKHLDSYNEDFEVIQAPDQDSITRIASLCRDRNIPVHISAGVDGVLGIITTPYKDDYLRNSILNSRGINV